jgi:membrane protein implicated in regulation of membrane protease activity
MIIYAALGGGGLVLLLVMLLAGGLGDHDVPIHEASLDHGDLDGHGGPSPLGLRVVASFVTFFGVGGIIGQYLGWAHPASSVLGIVLGLMAGTLVHRFAVLLHKQQADSHLSMADLVRHMAQVTVAIPENGVGEVSLTIGAEQTAQLARSVDGQAIPSGGEVVITAVRGGQVLVKRSSHAEGSR